MKKCALQPVLRPMVIIAIATGVLGTVRLVSAATGFYWEAESITNPEKPWIFENTKTGYSGTGYLHWVKGSRGQGVLQFEFEIDKDGVYEVWLRGRRDQEGACAGAASDECNDVFTQMNNGTTCKTMIKGSWGAWIWQSRIAECNATMDGIPAKHQCKAGKNVLKVSGRSNGIKLDAVTVHLSGTTRPTAPTTSLQFLAPSRANVIPTRVGSATVYTMAGRQVAKFSDTDALRTFLKSVQRSATYVVRFRDNPAVQVFPISGAFTD